LTAVLRIIFFDAFNGAIKIAGGGLSRIFMVGAEVTACWLIKAARVAYFCLTESTVTEGTVPCGGSTMGCRHV
jgi:hypothetical protein